MNKTIRKSKKRTNKRKNKRVLTHKKKKHIGGFFWDYNEPRRFHKFENKDNYKDITFSDQTYKMKTNSIGHLGKEGIRNNFKLASYIINDEPERKLLLFAKSIDSSIYSFYPEAIYEKELEKILNPIIIGSQLNNENLNNLKLELKHVPEYPVPVPYFLKEFVKTTGGNQMNVNGSEWDEWSKWDMKWDMNNYVKAPVIMLNSKEIKVTLKSQSNRMYLIMENTGGEKELYLKDLSTDTHGKENKSIFYEATEEAEEEAKAPKDDEESASAAKGPAYDHGKGIPIERDNLQQFLFNKALYPSQGTKLAYRMFDSSVIAKRNWDLQTFIDNNKSSIGRTGHYRGLTRGGLPD